MLADRVSVVTRARGGPQSLWTSEPSSGIGLGRASSIGNMLTRIVCALTAVTVISIRWPAIRMTAVCADASRVASSAPVPAQIMLSSTSRREIGLVIGLTCFLFKANTLYFEQGDVCLQLKHADVKLITMAIAIIESVLNNVTSIVILDTS